MSPMNAPADAAVQAPLVIARTYRAGIEDLWALWTTREGFESWWGPEGFRVEVHALEARAGGVVEYDMIADTAEMVAAMKQMGQAVAHNTHGWFGEFRPNTRLTLLHLIDFIAGVEPYESAIEVDFVALGDQAQMTVTLHPHRDAHWTKMSVQGFTSQLAKLEGRFGT
jgi:uncharacterized protein YndB with AHSA1/START domain